MALEIVAVRALAPYVGMSLYSWTVIIAVVLSGLSLGHWTGGRMAEGPARRLSARAAAALALAAATALVSLRLLGLVEPWAAGSGPVVHVAALALSAFFAPSLFAGLLSPLLTRLALEQAGPERAGRALGAMFAAGAAGAILGTLASGLVLIPRLGTGRSALAIGLLYALLSVPYWRGFARAAAAAAAAALLAVAAAAPERLVAATACLEESAYFCIRVDDVAFMGREARLMALDHLVHGVNDLESPTRLLSPYLHGVDEIVRRRFEGPALDAFFIGGGAYTLPRAWLARYPEGRLMVAEIDPAVTRIARARMGLPASPRLRTVAADARWALRRLPPERRFDVIFGDAFRDVAIPPHLVTDEFHAEIARRLRPGGLYAINVVDALREPYLVLSLARTLRRRFEAVELWLDAAQIGPSEARTTWIVTASDRPIDAPRIAARSGFDRLWLNVPLEEMLEAVSSERLATLTDDHAPVERLLAPVLLDPAYGG